MDEYDPEAKHFFEETAGQTVEQFKAEHTLPLLENLWAKQFMLSSDQLAQRRPALRDLAQQIARFFGPEAVPDTRQTRQTRQTQAPQP